MYESKQYRDIDEELSDYKTQRKDNSLYESNLIRNFVICPMFIQCHQLTIKCLSIVLTYT